MLAVLQAFAVIAIVIVVGIIVGRYDVLGENARMVLNRAAFHIGVPALMLIGLADAQLSQVFSLLLLASAVAAMAVYVLYFGIAKLMRRPRGETVIGSMLASYVNAGNLGIPVSAYVLGSTTEVSAIILFQILVLAPISLGLLDAENSRHKPVAKRVLSLFTNPIIAASAVGLILAETDVDLPQVLRDPLELLAALAVPTVLLAFGISLSARTRGDGHPHRGELALAIAFKILLMPAVAYGVAWALGADHHQLEIATVLAALPSAQNINTYAALYKRGETLARDATLISTILAVPVIVAVVALTE
ncbi:AEC family transporter [Mycolicibacterium wolinskyi]|uniref:AEC family transporter n=1 Tax=Mycolicibacterium wolinskyi TaxID=59750 RepID=UPI003917AEFA